MSDLEELLALSELVITGAKALYNTYEDAKAGKTSVSDALAKVQASIDAMATKLTANDAAAEQALDAKFEAQETPVTK